MKKISYTLLGILLSLLLGCSKPDSHDKLIIGMSADYPPFEYKEGADFKGFDVDLASKIGLKLHKEIELKDLPYSSLLASLDAGQIDMVISSVTKNAAREKKFDLSKPYYFDEIAVIFPKNNPLNNASELEGKKVGCQLGSTMEMWAKEHIHEGKIVSMDLGPALVEALKAKQLDAVIMDASQAQAFTQKNAALSYFILGKADDGYAVVLKKGSSLLSDVNTILDQFQEDGTLEKLQQKWVTK